MRALWAGGNVGAALNAYEACRRLLADEVGSSPSQTTQALFLDILRSPRAGSAGSGSPTSGRRGAAPSTLLLLERQTDCVGRAALFDRLGGLLDDARESGPRFVALGGEPGSGKTLVAARLAVRAHAAGMSVLYGCADDRIALANGPFLEALDTYFSAFDPAQTVLALGEHGAVLSRLLPSMADATTPGSEDDEPEQVADAIAHAVSGAAADRGGLLVLDDMQWAGDECVTVLERIGAVAARVLVLVLHRRAVVGLLPMEHIALEPLSVNDIAALARLLGRDDSPTAAAAIWRQSGGNPLLATELMCWSAGEPRHRLRRIVELLHERMAGLPGDAQDVLATAAVAGLEFDPRLVVAASTADPQDARQSLLAAERAAMLAPAPDGPGRLAFRHGLLRSSLLESLEGSTRMRVHQRLGSAQEGRFRRAGDPAAPTPDVVGTLSRALSALKLAGDPVPSARLELESLLRDARSSGSAHRRS